MGALFTDPASRLDVLFLVAAGAPFVLFSLRSEKGYIFATTLAALGLIDPQAVVYKKEIGVVASLTAFAVIMIEIFYFAQLNRRFSDVLVANNE